MTLEQYKGVHCVDLGESFQTRIYLENLASIPPRTSLVKFAASRPATTRAAFQPRSLVYTPHYVAPEVLSRRSIGSKHSACEIPSKAVSMPTVATEISASK